MGEEKILSFSSVSSTGARNSFLKDEEVWQRHAHKITRSDAQRKAGFSFLMGANRSRSLSFRGQDRNLLQCCGVMRYGVGG